LRIVDKCVHGSIMGASVSGMDDWPDHYTSVGGQEC